jgi:hypothetical protein
LNSAPAVSADVAKEQSGIAQSESAKVARASQLGDLDQRAKTPKKPNKINTREAVAKDQKVPQKALQPVQQQPEAPGEAVNDIVRRDQGVTGTTNGVAVTNDTLLHQTTKQAVHCGRLFSCRRNYAAVLFEDR